MGRRVQKCNSLPNIAVGSPSQLGAHPPFWGVNSPHNHQLRNFDGSYFMGWKLQKYHSLPNMAVGSHFQLCFKYGGLGPRFGGSIHPMIINQDILVGVTLWVGNRKDTIAYQIWRWVPIFSCVSNMRVLAPVLGSQFTP